MVRFWGIVIVFGITSAFEIEYIVASNTTSHQRVTAHVQAATAW